MKIIYDPFTGEKVDLTKEGFANLTNLAFGLDMALAITTRCSDKRRKEFIKAKEDDDYKDWLTEFLSRL